jgi:undecaprenyl-diphosphatase
MDKKRVGVLLGLALLGVFSFFFLDSFIVSFFNSWKNSVLTFVLAPLEPFWVYVLLAIGVILLLYFKNKKALIRPLVYSSILAWIASFALKFAFMRPRPLGFIEYIPFTRLMDYSFPSSHVMFMFAILPFLFDKDMKRCRYVFMVLAGLVVLSRLYFNMHYLSDVIFGGVLGYMIGSALRKQKSSNIKLNKK